MRFVVYGFSDTAIFVSSSADETAKFLRDHHNPTILQVIDAQNNSAESGVEWLEAYEG